jgi:hypothetical protein
MYQPMTDSAQCTKPDLHRQFLDFPSLSKYHNKQPIFKSITIMNPNKPLEVGDKVQPEFDLMGGMKTEAKVLVCAGLISDRRIANSW